MANSTVKTPIATVYLDNFREDSPTASILLANQVPQSGEKNVRKDALITLFIFSLTSDALTTATKVWVTDSKTGVEELAFDGSAGGAQPGYNGPRSASSAFASPGSSVNDCQQIVIDKTSDFSAGATVTVRVSCGTTSVSEEMSYTFTVQDTSAPVIVDDRWLDPKRVLVKFSKKMKQPAAYPDRSEVIGFGDGTTAGFVYNTNDKPIRKGTLEIQAEDASGNQMIVADNGKGSFVGDYDPTQPATIDYQNGAVAVSFLVAPRINEEVKIAYSVQIPDPLPDPTHALYFKNLSGSIRVKDSSTLVINEKPLTSWVGLYIGIGNSHPRNNGYHKITAVDTTLQEITVDSTSLRADDAFDRAPDGSIVARRTILASITPYKLVPRPDLEKDADGNPAIAASFAPIVADVEAVDATLLKDDEDPTSFAILHLQQPISLGRIYDLYVSNAVDHLDIAADGATAYNFTSPIFGLPADRWKVWDTLPETDKSDDVYRELKKFSVVSQDVLDILYFYASQLKHLRDPDLILAHLLDYLLHALGNGFQIPLTEIQKRRLALRLVPAYKILGTEKAIEDLLSFFLGFAVDVRPYLTSEGWVLGTSELGVSTELGPGTAFARNSYEIISYFPLTQDQRDLIKIIATAIDPANMHLVRIREHTYLSPEPLVYWTLGESALGYSTTLA